MLLNLVAGGESPTVVLAPHLAAYLILSYPFNSSIASEMSSARSVSPAVRARVSAQRLSNGPSAAAADANSNGTVASDLSSMNSAGAKHKSSSVNHARSVSLLVSSTSRTRPASPASRVGISPGHSSGNIAQLKANHTNGAARRSVSPAATGGRAGASKPTLRRSLSPSPAVTAYAALAVVSPNGTSQKKRISTPRSSNAQSSRVSAVARMSEEISFEAAIAEQKIAAAAAAIRSAAELSEQTALPSLPSPPPPEADAGLLSPDDEVDTERLVEAVTERFSPGAMPARRSPPATVAAPAPSSVPAAAAAAADIEYTSPPPARRAQPSEASFVTPSTRRSTAAPDADFSSPPVSRRSQSFSVLAKPESHSRARNLSVTPTTAAAVSVGLRPIAEQASRTTVIIDTVPSDKIVRGKGTAATNASASAAEPAIEVDSLVQVCIRIRPMNSMEISTGQSVAWSWSSVVTAASSSASSGGRSAPQQRRTKTKYQITQTYFAASSIAATNAAIEASLSPISAASAVVSTSATSKHMTAATFAFDHLFGPSSSNADLFAEIGAKAVKQVLAGYHACIFAYGQTSSGKSHSIHGAHHDPGMIPLSISSIFDFISSSSLRRDYVLRVAYLEVYNEVINDLLNPLATNLSIKENANKGIFIEGLKDSVVVSPEQIFALLSAGEAQRHVGKTNYNEASSRSHTIFQIIVESSDRSTEDSEDSAELGMEGAVAKPRKSITRSATFSCVDLAGSENAVKAALAPSGASQYGRSGNTAASRVQETGYINRSLLALGHVIYKLSEASTMNQTNNPGAAAAVGHIPYRDSKLTRLLQPSLSGSACVSIIATVSPSSSNVEETISTLKFARRAKRIRNEPKVNEVADASTLLIRKYREEITRLKQELEDWKKKHELHTQHVLSYPYPAIATGEEETKTQMTPTVKDSESKPGAADTKREGSSSSSLQLPSPGRRGAASTGSSEAASPFDSDEDDDALRAYKARPSSPVGSGMTPRQGPQDRGGSPGAESSDGGSPLPSTESSLTAQIEQLTRLILSSNATKPIASPTAKAGNREDEIGSDTKPSTSRFTFAPVAESSAKSSAAATPSSSASESLPSSGPLSPVSSTSGGLSIYARGGSGSNMSSVAATPISRSNASAAAAAAMVAHPVSGMGSVALTTYMDIAAANSLSNTTSASAVPVGFSLAAGALTRHPVFTADQIPWGANPQFFPTESNPILYWTRGSLESHYVHLLSAYASGCERNRELLSGRKAWEDAMQSERNKREAQRAEMERIAGPLLARLQAHLNGSSTSTGANSDAAERDLLREATRVLGEIQVLVAQPAGDAPEKRRSSFTSPLSEIRSMLKSPPQQPQSPRGVPSSVSAATKPTSPAEAAPEISELLSSLSAAATQAVAARSPASPGVPPATVSANQPSSTPQDASASSKQQEARKAEEELRRFMQSVSVGTSSEPSASSPAYAGSSASASVEAAEDPAAAILRLLKETQAAGANHS
jgi:hypothetical protein